MTRDASCSHQRTPLGTGAAVAIAALGAALAACAGHHHVNEAPPHPIAVEVNNNLTTPTELTVFIVQDQGGARRLLGTVPGARTTTFTYTPVAWGQTYRLVARAQLIGSIGSPTFTIADPQTGTIVWTVVPGIVQFFDLADTAVVPAAKPR